MAKKHLIANVDVPYKSGKDNDGNDTYGYARGGESFAVESDEAKQLVAENRAYYAKKNDEGNYVVDEAATQKAKEQQAQDEDTEASEASAEQAENRVWLNSASGMKGRDAAESNSMPSDAEDLTGRWVDSGNAVREQQLHEQAGATRPV